MEHHDKDKKIRLAEQAEQLVKHLDLYYPDEILDAIKFRLSAIYWEMSKESEDEEEEWEEEKGEDDW